MQSSAVTVQNPMVINKLGEDVTSYASSLKRMIQNTTIPFRKTYAGFDMK